MTERSTHHATFERRHDASPARVFAAWAEPTAKAGWFACHDDWISGGYELDFRVGGRERLSIGAKDGPVHAHDARYHDIVPEQRIVYSYDMHLDDRRISVSLATVELEPAGGGTRLTFTEQAVFLDGYDDVADREHGTRELLDSLAAVAGASLRSASHLRMTRIRHNTRGYRSGIMATSNTTNATDKAGATTFTTPSDREIVATRVVDARRRLVWEVCTGPEHLPHWLLGPDGWTMPICETDLRPGGAWHYGWRGPDGAEMEMRGVYREIAPPERLVHTESWGREWPETLNTLVLTEENGRTTMTCTVLYPSKEARDAALGTGMKEGWSTSYDRLDGYLRTIG
jgi:uncharacterized protein YndB with AHSA1/START domain